MKLIQREEVVDLIHKELEKLNDKKIEANPNEKIKQMEKIKSLIRRSVNEN